MNVTVRGSPALSVMRSMPRRSFNARGRSGFDWVEIELHHLIAHPLPHVLHADRRPHRAAGLHARGVGPQAEYSNALVRQAVSERIERLSLEVAIGAPFRSNFVCDTFQLLARNGVPRSSDTIAGRAGTTKALRAFTKITKKIRRDSLANLAYA